MDATGWFLHRPLAFTSLYLKVTLSHLDHLQVSPVSARPGYSMHLRSFRAFSPLGLCFSYCLVLLVKILFRPQGPLVLVLFWCFLWPAPHPIRTRNKCLLWNPLLVIGNNTVCLYLSCLHTCLISHSGQYISQRWRFHHLSLWPFRLLSNPQLNTLPLIEI